MTVNKLKGNFVSMVNIFLDYQTRILNIRPSCNVVLEKKREKRPQGQASDEKGQKP